MAEKAKLRVYVGFVATLATGISLGVVIGWFSRGGGGRPSTAMHSADDWRQTLVDSIKAGNIKENLRYMTKEPHLAGTKENKDLAEHLVSAWRTMGLDSAELVKYDVLLSYPGIATNRNRVVVKDNDGNSIYTSALEERILDPEQNNSKVVPPFNAYSKGGPPIRSSSLYYVNYGRAEDFEYLARNKSVNFTGSIVIARYGKIFRGNKVVFAQQYGAAGIILYSDPSDYAVGVNSTFDETFPNSWWLPPSGVQRGTTLVGNGDPQTPGYPSKDGVSRVTVEDLRQKEEVPSIPCHPIGYEDALAFLRLLPGSSVSETTWRGKLDVEYRYGGHMTNRTVELHVNNYENVTAIYNAIAVIEGVTEPDRYVLLGNHRDAWIFGSVDPSSGTASLLEVTRAFSELLKKGWRPRRTLVFCSWDAEEYGLIGSTEWVEEFKRNLAERAVAYINVDIAVKYPFILEAEGSPLLHNALYATASHIPDPEPDHFKTVFDSWQKRSLFKTKENKPLIDQSGSGSDHASFYESLGIPCVHMTYTYNKELWKISGYPLYHSVYETFTLMEKFIDPDFAWHQSISRVWAELARLLADSELLPLDPEDYAIVLQQRWKDFRERHGQYLQTENLRSIADLLTDSTAKFVNQSRIFKQEHMSKYVSNLDPYSLRRVNDQLMLLERAFADPAGLPGYPERKHLLYSQNSRDTYSGSAFPGAADALYGIQVKSGLDLERARTETRQQLARILFAVQSATSTLYDVKRLF